MISLKLLFVSMSCDR